MGRQGKAPREGGPAAARPESGGRESGGRESVGRESGARGAQVEMSVAPVAPAKGSVARVNRPLVDRLRVGLAGDEAQTWGRRARSGLWSAPCRLTPTATASSIATN